MTEVLPNATTVGDLCKQALKDAGALGIGQTPLAEDLYDAWVRLQWMCQGWNRARYLLYHLVTKTVASTGQLTPYTVGPGGQIDLGPTGQNVRPNRIESAFLQQLTSAGNSGPIRYPLKVLPSFEDYNKIALPNLNTFSLVAFYDPAFPLGNLYAWPWPNLNSYSLGITIRDQLPSSFPSLATTVVLPYEYFGAIVAVLAMALRPKYGIGTFPGDNLPAMARAGLAMLRKGNTAIANLSMPPGLSRNGIYNIFSDQTY